MLKYLAIPVFLTMAPLAFGQLDSNSITVTSSRGSSLQPDQVVIGVFVDTPLTASMSDVIAALAGSAITSANFAGVSQTSSSFTIGGPSTLVTPQLEWAFGLPVPFAKMKDALTALTALQQTVASTNKGFTLSFSVQGTTVSQQTSQAVTCSNPDLLADARAQAQKLADASGLTLGSVLAMSTSTAAASPGSGILGGISVGRFFTSTSSPTAPICALTVKFAVTRF
jgi:hypothetical protein